MHYNINMVAERKSPPPYAKLIDRRLVAMRKEQDLQQAKMEKMLSIAAANHKLECALHRFAVALISDAPKNISTAAVRYMDKYFGVSHAVVWREDNLPDNINAAKYSQLRSRVEHLGSVCDDRTPHKLRQMLFAESGGNSNRKTLSKSVDIASVAFIPIAHKRKLLGVLALGSADKTRFAPGKGGDILDRIGQLLGAYLVGWADN